MCPRTRNSGTMNCVPSVSWFIIPWPLVDLLFTHLALYTEINRHYSSYMFEFLSLKRKRNPLPLKKIKNKNKYLQKELYIMKQRRKTHNSHILIGWYIYTHTHIFEVQYDLLFSTPLPPVSLSGHFGALAGDLAISQWEA